MHISIALRQEELQTARNELRDTHTRLEQSLAQIDALRTDGQVRGALPRCH